MQAASGCYPGGSSGLRPVLRRESTCPYTASYRSARLRSHAGSSSASGAHASSGRTNTSAELAPRSSAPRYDALEWTITAARSLQHELLRRTKRTRQPRRRLQLSRTAFIRGTPAFQPGWLLDKTSHVVDERCARPGRRHSRRKRTGMNDFEPAVVLRDPVSPSSHFTPSCQQ